jgi:hypothetical protein
MGPNIRVTGTGNFFQFWPAQSFINLNREEVFDYGHITPLTWQKMYFHFAHHGFKLVLGLSSCSFITLSRTTLAMMEAAAIELQSRSPFRMGF